MWNHVYKGHAELTRPGRVDPEDPPELWKAAPPSPEGVIPVAWADQHSNHPDTHPGL